MTDVDNYDKLCLNAVIKTNDREAFTYLFNKFFPIVNSYLLKRFKHVRPELLQDVAIETMETWYFDKMTDWNPDFIGADLCRWAGAYVHGIIKPKFKIQPYSDFNENEQDSFMDALVYHGISSSDFDEDLAKMTFRLKKKVDRFVGMLSDRDYNVLMLFLDGNKKHEIAKKIGVARITSEIQIAFKHLKELVFNQNHFENKRAIYLKSNTTFTQPEVMEMYFKDRLSLRTISEIKGVKLKNIRSWVNRDQLRMNKTTAK